MSSWGHYIVPLELKGVPLTLQPFNSLGMVLRAVGDK